MTARGKGPPLKARQHRFAIEYCKDLVGTAAARRAGYAARSARFRASKLLADVAVRAAVDALLAASLARARLEVEAIDQALARVCFVDVRQLFRDDGTVKRPSEWDDDLAAAITSFEVHERRVGGSNGKGGHVVRVVRVRLADKVTCLALGYRRLGALRDNLRVSSGLTLEALVLAASKRKDEKAAKEDAK